MNNQRRITRREMLRRSAAATFAVAVPNPRPSESIAMQDDYTQYDALGLAELVAKRKVSPVELLGAVRRRIEAINPQINAFSHLFFERAEKQIQSLGAGPFRGVPFALKDIGVYLDGTVTASGCRYFKNNVGAYNSTLVARYLQSGLVIFGKTTTPEFGLTTTTESEMYGPTRNPWNRERIAGGSSGGAAAAVAARILPMAHGSDGGGSIRIPASCCGLFGLKPTRGRVPMGPSQFEGWAGASAHHALTVSVRDSAALLDVSAGPEPGSPYHAPAPARPFLNEVGADPGRLRIALVLDSPTKTRVDPECLKAAKDAARLCERLGHQVEEAALPVDGVQMRDAFLTVLQTSIARIFDDAAAARNQPVAESDVEPITWLTYQAGRRISGVAYARAVGIFHHIGLAMARFQEKYDVILSPTLGKPPVELGILSLSQRDAEKYGREVSDFSPFTSLYNITGQPSMSVPLHSTPDGLPVGAMFSARFGDEATLFRLASQLERAQPWAGRRPKL
ncbi:MAG: amidase [Blastocatellales bacterium]|nr:amidase [Blastocatellales bacterium]